VLATNGVSADESVSAIRVMRCQNATRSVRTALKKKKKLERALIMCTNSRKKEQKGNLVIPVNMVHECVPAVTGVSNFSETVW
jgi:hypothetical protein